jgi:hypothetical protein
MHGFSKHAEQRLEAQSAGGEQIQAWFDDGPVDKCDVGPCATCQRSYVRGDKGSLNLQVASTRGSASASIFANTTVRIMDATIPLRECQFSPLLKCAQGQTYTLPVRKTSNSPTRRPTLILRSQTILSGKTSTARSVTMLGTLVLFAKAWTLKHLPFAIDLFQLNATGVHWNNAATV